MTGLFRAQHGAEEFAEALEGTRPVVRAETAELVRVASALWDHAGPEPRPAFVAALRARLMAEAEVTLAETPQQLVLRPRGTRERRIVVAAAAVALLGGTTGVAAAAHDALPGEMLYPIKRGLEGADTGLSFGPASRGRTILQQASSRLSEIGALATRGDTASNAQIPDTFASFTGSAEEGSQLLLETFQQERDPQLVRDVRQFAAQGIDTLRDLADQLPAEHQELLLAAAVTLRDIDAEAAALCGTCAPDLPLLELPGLFLASTEVDQALRNSPAQELDNSHPVLTSGSEPTETAPTQSSGTGDDTTSTETTTETATEELDPTAAPDPAEALPEPDDADDTVVEEVAEGGQLLTGTTEEDGLAGLVEEVEKESTSLLEETSEDLLP